ncbi:Hypothetical protein CINCED_3A007064 [Cinara cedri]|uniref:Retrotransposon gag domain n=1 Tax=Cinara cedri TaxID=506608 RepID=A0A5E4N5E2_9HEMI|nr:Hypothetical protein CINCED_3A007064 [Cinara cedri]
MTTPPADMNGIQMFIKSLQDEKIVSSLLKHDVSYVSQIRMYVCNSTTSRVLDECAKLGESVRSDTTPKHREVKSWEALKGLLEVTFCAKRIPGYLQLELTTTKHKIGETIQEYSARVEVLLHELCNVSTAKRSPADAKAVHEYIKETILTTFVEGLPPY